MSRCVNPNSKAPMGLPPDLIAEFQNFTGWYAIAQFLFRDLTILEQVVAER
jgi:hypothetical protein